MAFPGITEIALIVGIAILALLIGPKKLPEFAESLGKSKKAYRESMKEAEEASPEDEGEVEEAE